MLLTGDGAGYNVGVGFHSTLERLHRNCCRRIELGGLLQPANAFMGKPEWSVYTIG